MNNKRKVVLLRSIDMLPDPRVEKYVDFYKSDNIAYTLIGWNRSLAQVSKPNTIYFNCAAEFGAGMTNVSKLIKFNMFLFSTLRKQRKNYDVIHACDFDTVLPALLVKFFWRKKVVFDVFDWYTDSRSVGNKFILRMVKFMERLSLRKSDYVIICDEEREEQLPIKIKAEKLKVLPNIPTFTTQPKPSNQYKKGPITLSYVGIFGTGRGLENLLKAVSTRSNIQLNIGGFGELQTLLEQYATNYENITYYGKMDYQNSLELMNESDIICAMYYKVNRNHIFAAPNKYFEGLFLNRPILTTEGTSIGKKTEKYKTGYVIGESVEDIVDFLNNLDIEQVKYIQKNTSNLWNTKYKTYVGDFMRNQYKTILK